MSTSLHWQRAGLCLRVRRLAIGVSTNLQRQVCVTAVTYQSPANLSCTPEIETTLLARSQIVPIIHAFKGTVPTVSSPREDRGRWWHGARR